MRASTNSCAEPIFGAPSELDNPDNRFYLPCSASLRCGLPSFLLYRFNVPRAREGNWRARRDSNQRVQRACFPFPRISLQSPTEEPRSFRQAGRNPFNAGHNHLANHTYWNDSPIVTAAVTGISGFVTSSIDDSKERSWNIDAFR
jgi:hypothetical protein